MTEQFLHGVQVLDIDDGARPISTVSTSVIGIIGTAPGANADIFPLNTPVMVAASRIKAASLVDGVADEGTLPSAMDGIFDQTGAAVIVVRVEEGEDAVETLANILGGVNSTTGNYEGVHAFLGAESIVGFKPKILIAPGFTHQRVTGGILTLTGVGGTGYTDGTWPLTVSGGTGGSGAAGTATIVGGVVTTRTITNAGSGYIEAPTFVLPLGAGSGSGATFVVSIGITANAVVSELVGIAERLRAVIIQDGPSTTDEAAIAVAGDIGSKRVYLVDPRILKADSEGITVPDYASACVAGLIAKSDNERGFWFSPSNQNINGIIGTERAVDFSMGDVNSRANLLNASNVATIIRQNGFRLWGNRTLSPDAKWAFLSIVRTADTIAESIQAGHLWAVDRGITKNYMQDVREGVIAYLRGLKTAGGILGGDCWIDPELNTPSNIAQGKVYWDFDFTGVYPAEHLTFRMHLVDNYITEIF